MSPRILVLAFLVAAPSAFAMGHWQGEHVEAEEELSTVRVNAPAVAKPGAGAVEAVRYLSGYTPPAPDAAPVAPSAPVVVPAVASPGPPPIDIAIRFRRDVSAVLPGAEPHIILAGGRRIGSGDVYEDGWRLRQVSTQTAVLAKGSDSRTINLFSAPPPQPTMEIASAAPLMTGPVAFSNGLLPDQRSGQQARVPLQSQQVQMMEQLRARMAERQARGQGGNGGNNGGRRGGQQAGPNGGFGGGGGGFRGGFNQGGGNANAATTRRTQDSIIVTVPPPPPPPPPSVRGN